MTIYCSEAKFPATIYHSEVIVYNELVFKSMYM